MYGTTLGLLGFGNIAQELARRAQAFGCDVVIWARRFADDPTPDLRRYGLEHTPGAQVEIASTPAEVADRADILSVHLALDPETRGLVGADLLGRLRPGALFINTARAEVVDYEALARRCGSGGSGWASTSIQTNPPPEPAPSTTHSSHCPGCTGPTTSARRRSRRRRRSPQRWSASSSSFKGTGRVPNVVNLARRTPATHVLVIRHRDRPGVLAHVFEHLRRAEINAQETENIVFEGAEAAIARINVDRPPTQAQLDAIASGNEHILSVQLVAL